MKADLSRDTFERTRHYLRVLSQQGRVYADADANEQTSILLHHLHTVSRDVIGAHGGPEDDLGFTLMLSGGDLLIGPGRYYVDGILCEVEPPPTPDEAAAPNAISYFEQPDYPVERDDDLPRASFLAYLDIWERHVTAIDDGHIREVALGGPDTATRSQVVWQVNIADELGGRPLTYKTRAEVEKDWSKFVTMFRPESGTLAAGTADPVDETDPCITPPAAGFRGAENQLYRVEIVTPGAADDDATFVWSRENGSVLSGWDQQGNRLTLADPGRDPRLGFDPGHWVELTDDVHELTGVPGTFARITRVDADVLTVDADTATGPLDPATFLRNPKLRRWDSDGLRPVTVPATGDGWISLEDGVRVRFSNDGTYRTGDYWLIPARVLGGVEWDVVDDVPVQRQPHGAVHHYAPLALFVAGAGAAGGFTLVDLRYQFETAAKPVQP